VSQWKAPFSHINQKSVDFVLCNKTSLKPLLAIELDDWSHDRQDRVDRDASVEQMLLAANFPLLRFSDVRNLSHEDVASRISAVLDPASS
jgi:very-short-patch-repair endonuclease